MVVSPDEKQARNFAVLGHLSAFLGIVVPFGNIIGPLAIWLWKRNELPFVEDQAREALNFQITMTIAFVVSAFLMMIIIGFLLLFVLAVAEIILVILAAIKASNGEYYRYPFALRLIA